MFYEHSPRSTSEHLFHTANHSLVFSQEKENRYDWSSGNNAKQQTGCNQNIQSHSRVATPQPITRVAARSVFASQQPPAAINTSPGSDQFVVDNTTAAFNHQQHTMSVSVLHCNSGHYELSNTPSDVLMPSSMADCGFTSPIPKSPLRTITNQHSSNHHHHLNEQVHSCTIKTPIPRISGGIRVSKPSSDTPYHRRQRLLERAAMPILTDHILDMRLCSSPVLQSPSTSSTDPSGEIHRLPHFCSPKDTIRRISPQTMVDLIDGRFANCYTRLLVIDCRYPYEYLGGHIPGAININTPDAIDQLLLENPLDASHHTCIIFHCEFSSQRAPRMALHVRNFDRLLNSERYPHLHYPEIYILDGGYKAFFDSFAERCEPPFQYLPMKNPNNKDDLRYHQKLRQSFRSHWAHGHISKRPAKHFKKSQSLTAIDPARSFFKQLSESGLAETTVGNKALCNLDSVNEFDMHSQDLQDLPSSIY